MLDTVLCVDDDPIALMLCKMVINKSGFSNNIVTAKNGEDALNYFNVFKKNNPENQLKQQPQLIFLDLNMSVMGGWEFLDYFSSPDYSDYNTIKVIILSSTIDPEDLEKAKKYPIVIDFLSKPISREMLEYIKDKIKI